MITELKARNQKSYYGKALIINNEKGVFLQSYQTIVCGIVKGEFKRFWSGYSATTQKHINDFLDLYDIKNAGGKNWWMSQVVYNYEEV